MLVLHRRLTNWPLRRGAPRLARCCAIASLLALSLPAHGISPGDAGIEKPNVIFILADDLGYGDLGCYGQRRIATPNLDRMAEEGMRFTDAYAGAPVCAPSRCVLMTGKQVGHARIRGNVPATEPGAALLADDVTVASVLRSAGYATGLVGKWGLGEPTHNAQGLPGRQGFDYFFGYLKHGHAHNYYTDYLWENETKVSLPNVISKRAAHKGNVAEKKVVYSHDLFAEHGLEFIRQHKDRPFFLYLSFTIPHANDEAGDEGMEIPDYGDYASLDWPTPQKGHAAMISRMDRDVGRILALLMELDLDRKTLVIFASDNGPHHEGGVDPDFNDSNGPLRGYKGNVTEGGIRVPFIARWPGRISPGKTSGAPISFADVFPTFASLANQSLICLDGISFLPTLLGRDQPELRDRFLYWEFYKNGVQAQSTRWKNWKAVRDPKSQRIELYDLANDVGEERDLASHHPKIVQRFKDYFSTARTEDSLWPMRPNR